MEKSVNYILDQQLGILTLFFSKNKSFRTQMKQLISPMNVKSKNDIVTHRDMEIPTRSLHCPVI